MSNPLLILVGSGIRPKPAIPPQFQTIPCPAGMSGAGQDQTRVCTWDVPSQSWVCTPWNTVAFNCVPNVMQFVTALQRYSPAFGGRCYNMDPPDTRSQTYAPPSVTQGEYTLTLSSVITCQSSGIFQDNVLNVTILKNGLPAAGLVQITWDRDYASFADQNLNGSGQASWSETNDQFVENFTQFVVTFTPTV